MTQSRTVVDLFSCGGGMSAGFRTRDGWKLLAAVDLEVAKPSGKAAGETSCNVIYQANHELAPLSEDIHVLDPKDLMASAGLAAGDLTCLISCAPCTDFSRANPDNHLSDRKRNTLVGRSGDFIESLLPEVFVMENARELLTGNHPEHWIGLKARLKSLGYDVRADVHFLNQFGLPQIRERALIIASRVGPARTLEDLWRGTVLAPGKATVRTALARLETWLGDKGASDPTGAVYPGMGDVVASRLRATPKDGGGWIDVAKSEKTRHLLTPECAKRWASGDWGSHPDVYGRMWWDKAAPTIKRESAHIGNGRYAHPEKDRLLTVREMATLQGFPFDYSFPVKSIANRYRAIGDAVPPLIAWQIAACVEWTLSGVKPDRSEWVMPNTCFSLDDIEDLPIQAAA
ncbi:MAG: DNA cytosine methyltransferase [Comamonadaceae bacterium]|nr:MAG: DNA cytosine methyltransferase [Comamonadaceae bacterium]